MKSGQSKATKSKEVRKDAVPGPVPTWPGFTIGAAAKADARRAWLEANKPSPDLPSRYDPLTTLDKHEEAILHWFTWNHVESNPSCLPANDTAWRDLVVEAATAHTSDGLRHLASLASSGDQGALAALADIGISVTRTLSELASRVPERVRPIARCRFFWPFLKARKERFGDDHKHLVKKIDLGHATPFSEGAVARVRPNKVTVRTAMSLLCRLNSYRRGNPAVRRMMRLSQWENEALGLAPFSSETWTCWFEVGWKALLGDHKGHPEQNPELRKIGLYRAEHSTDRYSGAQAVAPAKTRNANIQDGIRESLRLAIKRLAPIPKKFSKK